MKIEEINKSYKEIKLSDDEGKDFATLIIKTDEKNSPLPGLPRGSIVLSTFGKKGKKSIVL